MKVLLVPLLLSIAMASCAKGTSPAPGDGGSGSGIRGSVLAGPACGGPVRAGSPCPDVPVEVKLVVTRQGSTDVVATTRSGRDGSFSVALPPGGYAVTADPSPAPFPNGPPVQVHVEAGKYAEVTIRLDTGIR